MVMTVSENIVSKIPMLNFRYWQANILLKLDYWLYMPHRFAFVVCFLWLLPTAILIVFYSVTVCIILLKALNKCFYLLSQPSANKHAWARDLIYKHSSVRSPPWHRSSRHEPTRPRTSTDLLATTNESTQFVLIRGHDLTQPRFGRCCLA